jgi:allantoicase
MEEVQAPDFAKHYVNLADADFGAKVLSCSDDWFAPADRMLQSAPAVFIPGKYDDHGKWMDGWESKRRRRGGHDQAIVKLGMAGSIVGFDLDTSHFTGNFPPGASIEACRSASDPDAATVWTEILPAQSLGGDAHHFFPIGNDQVWTHLRLNIYPDGGVARLRVYGRPFRDWAAAGEGPHEVSALANGGRVIGYNNAHYGTPFRLLMPGRGVNMGDGWETRRRREPGNDWCIVALGRAAVIEKIEIDTAHFKGNYPDRASILAANVNYGSEQSIVTQAMFWDELLPEQELSMDAQHFYEKGVIRPMGPITHVRLNIFPDGGISRLRLWGKVS